MLQGTRDIKVYPMTQTQAQRGNAGGPLTVRPSRTKCPAISSTKSAGRPLSGTPWLSHSSALCACRENGAGAGAGAGAIQFEDAVAGDVKVKKGAQGAQRNSPRVRPSTQPCRRGQCALPAC